MISGMRHSVAGMTQRAAAQEVVANNLANLSTSGYKADRVTFAEVLLQAAPTTLAPAQSSSLRVTPTDTPCSTTSRHELASSTTNDIMTAHEGRNRSPSPCASGERGRGEGPTWRTREATSSGSPSPVLSPLRKERDLPPSFGGPSGRVGIRV